MPKQPTEPAQSLILNKDRCHFTTIDGRRCRMHRAARHKTLCFTHALHEKQTINAESVAAELIGPVEEYQTAICVNRALGSLFNLVAQKRISRHDGALLAFIGQLMLHSVGSSVKEEFYRMANDRRPTEWEANIRRSVEILSNDYSLRRAPAAAETSEEDDQP